ncbi:NADH dehydrogenase I subunit 4L [Vigna unguiculata]|uniref:ATP synthase protein MI25 n=1 Tax=Vigna unguiculata TaxID=3917 RepID=A0A4D6L511_VIGUN|nr:NADH dehydrogenase I subunit 4L [Vigna unguiculata]
MGLLKWRKGKNDKGDGARLPTRRIGIRGILLNRRNIPIMSMPIESMLLAVNSNFLVFSVSSDDMMGQSFASLVSTVAAAESAIGLAIFVITFRVRGTIAVEFINSIQESQQFPNPNEVVPPESNEQQRLLRISLRICGTVVESLPMARCAPKCEKTVQALLCRNLNVKSLGNTFKVTLDGRIQAIQEESQQFPNPNEVVPSESNEQQRLLRISLRICGTIVESLPMARCGGFD